MKLCSIKLARSVWLLPVGDLNPRGRYLYDVIMGMKERYSFVKVPTPEEAANEPNNLQFVQGSFMNKNNERVAFNFTAHGDGLIVDTGSSTQDCDDFLVDLLSWFRDNFGYEDYSALSIRKLYVSELYVTMKLSRSMINPVLEQYARSLSSQIVGHEEVELDVFGISFGADPGKQSNPINFRIERAAQTATSENRYYSVGPFQTETHLNLLQKLESLLSA